MKLISDNNILSNYQKLRSKSYSIQKSKDLNANSKMEIINRLRSKFD